MHLMGVGSHIDACERTVGLAKACHRCGERRPPHYFFPKGEVVSRFSSRVMSAISASRGCLP